jgi:hypothetical protein
MQLVIYTNSIRIVHLNDEAPQNNRKKSEISKDCVKYIVLVQEEGLFPSSVFGNRNSEGISSYF